MSVHRSVRESSRLIRFFSYFDVNIQISGRSTYSMLPQQTLPSLCDFPARAIGPPFVVHLDPLPEMDQSFAACRPARSVPALGT